MDHQGIQEQLSKRGIFLRMYYTKPQSVKYQVWLKACVTRTK